MDGNATMSAASRRKLLKQQRQSSENYVKYTCWQSDEQSTVWQSAEDCSYYDDYNSMNTTMDTTTPVMTPMHPPKKRTLPQIRAPSRIKASAVSLPQTPVRQLPNPLAAVNKQRVSAPVSRTTSAEYDQNEVYNSETFNENYNYAYVSTDNLLNEKFSAYPGEIRTSDNYQISYETAEKYIDSYENKENYPEMEESYKDGAEQYLNTDNSLNNQKQNLLKDDYYAADYYQEGDLKAYYETDVTEGMTQKNFLERRSNSPFVQQNTDSLESRDDELRDESFETAVDSICSSVPVQKQITEYPLIDTGVEYKLEPTKPSEQQQQSLQQQPQPQQQRQPEQTPPPSQQPPQQSVGMLGGLLGQLTKSPSQYLQQQQQQQQQTQQQQQMPKTDQRSRDQSNLLTNPALAAMNATKGFFSSITNAVNNTVQNINKQQKPQQQQQQVENQVQRIQVTKRGSLKQQESVESQKEYKSHRNSFDSQVQDYIIPEEPEYIETKEEDYYESQDKYYDYDEKDYYESQEAEFPKEADIPTGSELDQLESSLRSNRTRDSDPAYTPKRLGQLRHQDTVDSKSQLSEVSNRSYLRQQDSLDSCAEEMIMHNSGSVNGSSSPPINRYEDSRTGAFDFIRNDKSESNHMEAPRKRGSGHDNSLIEPYHPSAIAQDIQKDYSPSPPSIQKQQSIDLEGIEEEEVQDEPPEKPEESEKPASFEVEPEQPIKVVVPERRKYTAKERWHRAYNIVVQQLNVSLKI